ncbi:MAG TPA: HD domain-containing protein [Candidatus Paceibacterota bacterium]|nr:HD domain-containing protein [Candidatus Paceibacterota bacterium]
MENQVTKLETKVKELLGGEGTGHDWYHIKQVRDMALRIAESEGGDKELIELAALAHDIGDHKFHASEEEGEEKTRSVLAECGIPSDMIEKIMGIVHNVSYKGPASQNNMTSLEGKIVQDADRLYALGAIGIARTFAYGGSKHRPLYDPDAKPDLSKGGEEYYKHPAESTINHFYEKLLLVKDRMNTATAKRIAEHRHQYMEDFLKQFYKEWEAKD